MMNIGICGSHRVGKTTLAATVAERLSIPFLRTNTSEIMRGHGVDPSLGLDFATRLEVQHRILEAYEEIFAAQTEVFITDRTPVDLMAYTLADINGATDADHQRLAGYLKRCFHAANYFFGLLYVIQPGIPLVAADGKGPASASYMEHLNTLVLGLCADERNQTKVIVNPRAATGLEARARHLIQEWAWASAGQSPEPEMRAANASASTHPRSSR